MSIRDALHDFFITHDPRVFIECRDCGTTLDSPAHTCPVCHSPEIAYYDI